MKRPSRELLEKYFQDRCTKTEAKRVLDWLATSDGQSYYNTILEERIDKTSVSDLPRYSNHGVDMLKKIYRKIQKEQHLNRKVRLKYWLATAAAISAIVAGVFLTSNFVGKSEKSYATDFGEVKTIELKDGTEIVLNANSGLTFINERDVKLKGEAFFSVKHLLDDSPFIVRTDELEVKVLGTEFNVNSRRQETEVVLNSGSVRLDLYAKADTTQVAMVPGDLVSYSNKQESYRLKTVDTESITSWRDNRLLFDHTPFSEIKLHLEDNHGLDIEVKNHEIMDLEFTAELPANDVDLLLELMEKSFNISIVKTKNKVVMEKPIRFRPQ